MYSAYRGRSRSATCINEVDHDVTNPRSHPNPICLTLSHQFLARSQRTLKFWKWSRLQFGHAHTFIGF